MSYTVINQTSENPHLSRRFIEQETLREQLLRARRERYERGNYNVFVGEHCPNCDLKNTWRISKENTRKCEDCKCEYKPLI